MFCLVVCHDNGRSRLSALTVVCSMSASRGARTLQAPTGTLGGGLRSTHAATLPVCWWTSGGGLFAARRVLGGQWEHQTWFGAPRSSIRPSG